MYTDPDCSKDCTRCSMRCKSRRDAHKKYWVIKNKLEVGQKSILSFHYPAPFASSGKVPAVQLNAFADKINDEYHEQPGRMKANVMTYSEFKKRNYPNA